MTAINPEGECLKVHFDRGNTPHAEAWLSGTSFRCTFTPATRLQVHLAHVVLPVRRARARGGCASAPEKEVKAPSPKLPFYKATLSRHHESTSRSALGAHRIGPPQKCWNL